jgi:hypothetical protein
MWFLHRLSTRMTAGPGGVVPDGVTELLLVTVHDGLGVQEFDEVGLFERDPLVEVLGGMLGALLFEEEGALLLEEEGAFDGEKEFVLVTD